MCSVHHSIMSPHQTHRRVDREAPLLLGDVLLEDVGLDRPPQPLGRARPASSRGDDVEGQHDRRRRVDRHRHASPPPSGIPSNSVSMSASVSTATPSRPTSPSDRGVIGVVAHQRRHVERRRQPRLAVLQQVVEALVGLLGRPEARELAHRPQPASIHRRVDAPRERVLARAADRRGVRWEVGLGVERPDGNARHRPVRCPRHGCGRLGLARHAMEPNACSGRARRDRPVAPAARRLRRARPCRWQSAVADRREPTDSEPDFTA